MINFWLEVFKIRKLGCLHGEAIRRLRRLEQLGYQTDALFRWGFL